MTERLPLTVISGYLGAGKTSLINRLLSEAHGVKLLVMVNDFGAINIDAALIDNASSDTLSLANGCVCCTMGDDLFRAISEVLQRPDRPEHLIIEASGVADPARIAGIARTEPGLIYAGIVTVVDTQAYPTLKDDRLIGPQVLQQVRAADLICISKATEHDNSDALALPLGVASAATVVNLAKQKDLAPLLLAVTPKPEGKRGGSAAPHPTYIAWQIDSDEVLSRPALLERLENRPEGLMRLKGFVSGGAAESWLVQCVGPTLSVKRRPIPSRTQLVGIGLKERLCEADIEKWWSGAQVDKQA